MDARNKEDVLDRKEEQRGIDSWGLSFERITNEFDGISSGMTAPEITKKKKKKGKKREREKMSLCAS